MLSSKHFVSSLLQSLSWPRLGLSAVINVMDEFDPFSEVSFFLLVAYRYCCMCSLFCPEVTFRFLLIVTVVLFFFFFFKSEKDQVWICSSKSIQYASLNIMQIEWTKEFQPFYIFRFHFWITDTLAVFLPCLLDGIMISALLGVKQSQVKTHNSIGWSVVT